MLLPIKSKNPPEARPYLTMALILINCLVFVLTSHGPEIRPEVVKEYALSMANVSPKTFFASMFLHADLFHLLGNMWFLYLFGFAVEGRLKTFRFFLLYFIAGIAGQGLHLAMNVHAPNIPTLGASGAIMGTLGAALVLFPFSHYTFFYWFGFIWYGTTNWRMYWVAAYYLGIDILGALFNPMGGVANFAHIGGALGGAVMCYLLGAKRDSASISEAKATLVDFGSIEFLTIEELEEMAQTNPNNTKLILHWAKRCSEDHRGVSPACSKAFVALLPTIYEKESLEEITTTISQMTSKPGGVSSAVRLQAAIRAEKSEPVQIVGELLGSVLDDPQTHPADRESALYHMAWLVETRMTNPPRAIECYSELIRRHPFGVFAEQARGRIVALGGTPPDDLADSA